MHHFSWGLAIAIAMPSRSLVSILIKVSRCRCEREAPVEDDISVTRFNRSARPLGKPVAQWKAFDYKDVLFCSVRGCIVPAILRIQFVSSY